MNVGLLDQHVLDALAYRLAQPIAAPVLILFMQLAKLIAAGLANKEIARTLNLSHRTVEVHRARLMKKLRAGNVVELMHNAMISSAPTE